VNCEECGSRQATIRYTEMVDGQLRTWSLCDRCSRDKGVGPGLSSLAGPLVNILMSLLEDAGTAAACPGEEVASCPQCGLSYAEFRRTGRLGCGECYEAFGDELMPLLRRVHGCTEHVGRFPPGELERMESVRELRSLRSELAQAVRREDYERAAELRDEIRAVTKRGSARSDVDA
jgi:protein arginine kinase activator